MENKKKLKNRQNIEKVLALKIAPKEKFRLFMQEFIKKIKDKPQIVDLSLREMANYGANVDEQILPYIEQQIEYLRLAIVELPLKEKYKTLDIYLLKSLILGTVNNYYAFQMSQLDFKNLTNFSKDSDAVLDFSNDFLVDFILEGLCEQE